MEENFIDDELIEEMELEAEQLVCEQLKKFYFDTKAIFEDYFLVSEVLNKKPQETPFKDWKLKDIITYCLRYDYKKESITNYELALNEIYQRQKSKSGFYLLKDVRIVSNRVHGMSNCLGLFLWPRKDLRTDMCSIFVCDDRYNKKHGYSLITENNKNLGIRYLHTFFHESQHENQFSNVARFVQNGRISGADKVGAIFSLFYNAQQDYYSRFIEYDAEATAIKRMFKLYEEGVITKLDDITYLYERAVNFLANYDVKKVVKSVNVLLPELVTAINLSEPKKVRDLTNADVNAFIRKLRDTHHMIQGIKAEYEKYLLNTFSDKFKERMNVEAENLANLKQSCYEYNTKFLRKMQHNPYTVDHARSKMFLISYVRAKNHFERENKENQIEIKHDLI